MYPVKGSEELRRGRLTRNDLRRGHRAVFPDVYLANCVELDAAGRARAAWLWSGRRGVIAGRSAAALIAVEYDGDHHWTDRRQFAYDIRRTERLRALGWIVIRVTAEDSRTDILARIAEAFACRACG